MNELPAFDLANVLVDAALPLPELLRSVERQIARVPVEVGLAFNQQGSLILRKVGEQNAVKFTESEVRGMAGSFFTHNHPQRGFLSAADLLFAHQHDLAEMRAVAGDVVHILTRPATGWNEMEAIRLFIAGNNRLARNFSYDGNLRKLLAGQQRLAATIIKRLSLVVETHLL